MNAETFISIMAGSAPDISALIERGYSPEYANKIKETYVVKRVHGRNFQTDDPLLDLINNYDMTKTEFGYLRLGIYKLACNLPSGKVLIGTVEEDPLVINADNGEIQLLDHDNPDRVMAVCAKNGELFLDVLVLLIAHEPPHKGIFSKLSRKQKRENNLSAYLKAKECGKLAGIDGEENNIYELLLGCDPSL